MSHERRVSCFMLNCPFKVKGLTTHNITHRSFYI